MRFIWILFLSFLCVLYHAKWWVRVFILFVGLAILAFLQNFMLLMAFLVVIFSVLTCLFGVTYKLLMSSRFLVRFKKV